MKSCWIAMLCPLSLFFNASSANAPGWSVKALSSADTHSEMIYSSFTRSWRQKHEECSLNATTVRCSCKDGYKVPSDTSVAKLNCSSSIKGCDGVNSFPQAGAYCQLFPAAAQMTTMKITPPVTTVRATTPVTTETATTPVTTLTTVATKKPTTAVMATTPLTTPRTKYVPLTEKAKIKAHLTLLETFTADLNDETSVKYITYKTKFETEFYNSYRTFLKGFLSANVTGFRKGSVHVDYVIVTDPPTQSSLDAANAEIVSNLTGEFTFSPSPIVRFIYDQTNLTASPDILFQGDTLTLTCSTRSNSTSVNWTQNGAPVKIGATNTIKDGVLESVLVILSITTSDAGEYSCSLNDTTVIYEASRNVSVSSINAALDSSKYVLCDGNSVTVSQWCTDGDISYLTCSCTPSGGLSIPGTLTTVSNCQIFEVDADSSLCSAEMSDMGTNYRCQCSSKDRELISNTITVTFARNEEVLACLNDVAQKDSDLTVEPEEILACLNDQAEQGARTNDLLGVTAEDTEGVTAEDTEGVTAEDTEGVTAEDTEGDSTCATFRGYEVVDDIMTIPCYNYYYYYSYYDNYDNYDYYDANGNYGNYDNYDNYYDNYNYYNNKDDNDNFERKLTCIDGEWQQKSPGCPDDIFNDLWMESLNMKTLSQIQNYLASLTSNVNGEDITSFSSLNTLLDILDILSQRTEGLNGDMMHGFFILVFGALMDVETRKTLLRQFSLTRGTSQATESSTISTSQTSPTMS